MGVASSPAFKSKSSECKAANRVSRSLPKSPRKQKAVFKKLAVKLFPGKTIFKRKLNKKTSLLFEGLKTTITDFYCCDSISSLGPSMKDRYICRNESGQKLVDSDGKTVSVQKRYMCYTLNESYKLFCDQNLSIKISRTTFYNCKPDHVMLRADTPANTCLYTYHENMRLLVSAVEHLPDMTELVKNIVCDKKSKLCMMQSCDSCGHLRLWYI